MGVIESHLPFHFQRLLRWEEKKTLPSLSGVSSIIIIKKKGREEVAVEEEERWGWGGPVALLLIVSR